MIYGKIELSGEKEYTNEIMKLEIYADKVKVMSIQKTIKY